LLAGRVVGFVVMRVALVRVAPWLHYGRTRARQEDVKRLVRPAGASAAFPFGNATHSRDRARTSRSRGVFDAFDTKPSRTAACTVYRPHD
jgi:hypothetical protein